MAIIEIKHGARASSRALARARAMRMKKKERRKIMAIMAMAKKMAKESGRNGIEEMKIMTKAAKAKYNNRNEKLSNDNNG